jgi:ribosomal protein S1
MDELQGKQPSEVFNLDDTIQAAILNIDEKDKRIALSTRVLRRKENRVITETREENTGAFSTLGDILEPAMKKNSGDTTD